MKNCKFKPYQHIVAVTNGFGITKDNMYAVIETYTNASDIPCVKCIGDDGNVMYNYQTVFRAAKTEVEDMGETDAMFVVIENVDKWVTFVDDCFGKYDSGQFLTAIQTDKDLQKALLVLIGGDK